MGKEKMNVLVIGATGKQGNAVANLLLDHGHKVVAFGRYNNSEQAARLISRGARFELGDLSDKDALLKAIKGVDAIFGITIPFGKGGFEEEVTQGKNIADVAESMHVQLVYSSVAGAGGHRTTDFNVQHATSKQTIEAYMATKNLKLTTLAPVYFMENLLNFNFNGLRQNNYTLPLSPERKLDQVTVLDIAAMAIYALEHPDQLAGKRIELASDCISGLEITQILSEAIGRPIRYIKMPIEKVKEFAGEQIAKMYERLENNPYHIDIAKLHSTYPSIHWHSFKDWVKTIDWAKMLPS